MAPSVPPQLRNSNAGWFSICYAFLLRLVAAINTSFTNAFTNGGNNFGGFATIGTTNNAKLNVVTNNVERICVNAAGQVAVGPTVPNADAQLDVQSTTTGFLVPRMTTTQRLAVAAFSASLLVYDTTLSAFFQYNGTAWVPLTAQVGTGSIVNGVLAVTNVYLSASSVIAIDVGSPVPGAGNLTVRYGVLQASRTNGSGTGSFTISALNAAGALQALDESTNVRWSIVGT